jgi:hypothetical protein
MLVREKCLDLLTPVLTQHSTHTAQPIILRFFHDDQDRASMESLGDLLEGYLRLCMCDTKNDDGRAISMSAPVFHAISTSFSCLTLPTLGSALYLLTRCLHGLRCAQSKYTASIRECFFAQFWPRLQPFVCQSAHVSTMREKTLDLFDAALMIYNGSSATLHVELIQEMLDLSLEWHRAYGKAIGPFSVFATSLVVSHPMLLSPLLTYDHSVCCIIISFYNYFTM